MNESGNSSIGAGHPVLSQPRKMWLKSRLKPLKEKVYIRISNMHKRIPYIRKLPLRAILIIVLLISVNLLAWVICALILVNEAALLSTAALAYTLGLRHGLDADHISAIDLMTRRLIATGQRPVTVGTFFSLGHSTIVVITSLVVAATAAGVSSRFDEFSNVGSIIGTSVSAAFLTALGIMNAYILYKLIKQMQKVIKLLPEEDQEGEAWKVQGGGCLFRVLKRMFKLIDKPWKMYPLGVLFGLGFDTSSEVALLGISSLQGAQGTSIWLILIFPVLFTVGMCLIDTIDGALMMSLYVAPMGLDDDQQPETKKLLGNSDDREQGHAEPTLLREPSTTHSIDAIEPIQELHNINTQTDPSPDKATASSQLLPSSSSSSTPRDLPIKLHPTSISSPNPADPQTNSSQPTTTRVKNPMTFLYYSIVLTFLTVLCALVIGVLQFLSLLLNVIHPTPEGSFWDGVSTATDNYDIIGGSICGSFVVFGLISVLLYPRFRTWVERKREVIRMERQIGFQGIGNPDGNEGVGERELERGVLVLGDNVVVGQNVFVGGSVVVKGNATSVSKGGRATDAIV